MIPRRRIAIDAGPLALAWMAARRDPRRAVRQFEEAFAAWSGRRYAITSCSGRATLLAALRAVGAVEGSEVILPAYTLADLPKMLRRAGITPVFVDIDPHSYLLDPALVESAITPRTRAIVPTDLFGYAARWGDVLGELSAARGIPLVEDAAHAAGSKLDGRQVGRECRITFFSLETIKVLHSFGGGVVVVDDENLARSIRAQLPEAPLTRTFVPKKFARNLVENLAFRTPAYRAALMARATPRLEALLLSAYDRMKYDGVLTEYAYSGWQAAFAEHQLAELDGRVRQRRALAARLMDALDEALVFPPEPDGVEGNRYFVVGRADGDARVLQRALVRSGVDSGALGEITDFCPPESDRERFPHAYGAHRSLLQLPFYEGMTSREIDRVAAAVRRAVGRASPSRPSL